MEINIDNRKLIVKAKAPAKSLHERMYIFINIFGKMYFIILKLYVCIANTCCAIEALVKMFFQQEELAKTEEKKTDEILDGENKQTEKPAKDAPLKAHTQYIEETIALRK